MGYSGQHSESFSLGGQSFSNAGEDNSVAYDHDNNYIIPLPKGKTVTAWVKTDADTAACNLPASHGYTTGVFDVYWVDTGVNKRRYGVDGTVTVNALALDGGAGDDFPASATADVVVTRQVTIALSLDGDAIEIIGVFLKCDADTDAVGHLQCQDAADDVITNLDLAAGGVSKMANVYNVYGGDTNPFTGDPITQGFASNGSADEDAELYILAGMDATP